LDSKLIPAKKFQSLVLNWFDQHGRKDLPWQHDTTPYRVWISEIMLQQTQVKTAIPYYKNFMKHFPHVKKLASASDDEVLHHWTGLGYYTRARNLHKAAKMIVEKHHGIFPTTFEDIIALPGIGRSTAGAIMSIAMQTRQPILDGNVKRVLTRFAAIEGWTALPDVEKKLWQLADHYTPHERVEDYAQVMMDLGAMICTRTKPKCGQCPLEKHCIAHREHEETRYPSSKPKKAIPVKSTIMLMIKNPQNEIFLIKQPSSGIWGGLWILPQCDSLKDIERWCLNNNFTVQTQTALPAFRHTFSHYHLDIQPIELSVKISSHHVAEPRQTLWYNHTQAIGLAAPVKKLLEQTR